MCSDQVSRHNFGSESVILAFTRDQRCWHCESPLHRGFCGVKVVLPPNTVLKYPLLFLTCSSACQRRVATEFSENGVWAEAWGGPCVRRLLDSPEKIAGTLEDRNLGQFLKANRS
jgi:hypothetical protein